MSAIFPSYTEVAEALLALILVRSTDAALTPSRCFEPLADFFALSLEQRQMLPASARQGRAWHDCVRWSRQLLVNDGLLHASPGLLWRATDEGRREAISVPVLQRWIELGDMPTAAPREECYIDWDNCSVRDRWRLIESCYALGADEFSVTLTPDLRGGLQEEEVWHHAFEFWSMVGPFSRKHAEREGWLYDGTRQFGPEARPLWSLTPETIIALRAHVPDAASTYRSTESDGGRFEDPVFYRGEDVMLAVSADYGWSILRITSDERALLSRLAFNIESEFGPWA